MLSSPHLLLEVFLTRLRVSQTLPLAQRVPVCAPVQYPFGCSRGAVKQFEEDA